jgi:tRNA A-37 threonylcarbamoyl transferase component Bud32
VNDKPGSDKPGRGATARAREAEATVQEDDGWPELEVSDVLSDTSEKPHQWDDVTVRGFPAMEVPGSLSEGSRFGGYIVGPLIGEGGMARIYRAEHEGLQRQVALKVLLDNLGRETDGHERFLREARIAAAIKHPNVVNIFDVGIHQGRPYLVMELLEGKDLAAFVESEGPLPEAKLMDVIIPIVAGLAAVHDAGIVHRDLKPGNIFLARGRNDEIEPKLLDFGISKSSGPDQMRLTHSRGMLVGTPFYMSPEASRGEEMTPLSDQYALGVVLYEAATGTNPFAGANNVGEVVRQVMTGDYPPVTTRNARLSKKMVSIIERAMHLDPTKRFPDMRGMGRELLTLAGQRTRITWGLSFSEITPTALARPPEPGAATIDEWNPRGRKRRAFAWLAAGAAAAAAVWLLWPRLEPVGMPVARNEAPKSSTAERTLPLQPTAPAARPATEVTAAAPSSTGEAAPSAGSEAPAPNDDSLAEDDGAVARTRDTTNDAEQPREQSGERGQVRGRRIAPETSALQERTPAAQSRPARPRPRRANRVVARRTEAPASDAPDWVVSAPEGTQAASAPGAERGTNNAPILPID